MPSERSRTKSSSSLFWTATRPWTWSSITVSPSRGALRRMTNAPSPSSVAVAPRAVDPERAALGLRLLALRGQLLLAHPAAIGVAALEQLVRDFGVARPELRLVIFVPVPIEAEPAHPVEDRVDRLVGRARLVGILDAQQELAAVVAGEQPVEQRRARAADVQEAGRGGREAGDHGRLIWCLRSSPLSSSLDAAMQWTSAPNIAGAPLPQRARGFWKARLQRGSGGGGELPRGGARPASAVGRRRLRRRHRAVVLAGHAERVAGGAGAGRRRWRSLGFAAARRAGGAGARLVRRWRSTLGCALIWARSEWVAAPRLERPLVTEFAATVERVEPLVAKGDVRLTLAPTDAALAAARAGQRRRGQGAGRSSAAARSCGCGRAWRRRRRWRCPAPTISPATPGSAASAAVGRALGPVEMVARRRAAAGSTAPATACGRHIREQLPGSAGGIATALATGDQNAVGEEDAEAMRRSGLTHLLSVSGLHIAAVVGAVMLLTLKLLALSPSGWRCASTWSWSPPAPGAVAGVAYTLLTGAQVPTVRSCVAALLVLAGIALGRDALSMRLLAVGALVVLLFRPEVARRRQLPAELRGGHRDRRAAFDAVGAADVPAARGRHARAARAGAAGHGRDRPCGRARADPDRALPFPPRRALRRRRQHRRHPAHHLRHHAARGAARCCSTSIGLGAPFWWLTGKALDLLLWLAHTRRQRQGRGGDAGRRCRRAPSRDRRRRPVAVPVERPGRGCSALVPFAIGARWPPPRPRRTCWSPATAGTSRWSTPDGAPLLLRERSGDFVREVLAESAGFDGEPRAARRRARSADCSRDSCVAALDRGGRRWQLLATRSRDM